MPAPGCDFDSRLPTHLGRAMHGVALEQRMREFHFGHAEIGDGGADGHVVTEMPIIRPSVNSEFISGWPHSVSVSQKCRSICSGCGLSVMLENKHVVHLRHGAGEPVLV